MVSGRIQYVTTSDGIRIAYSVTGSGPALVFVTEPVISHTDLEWSHPIFGAMLASAGGGNTLVRYDSRGTGLSDRDPRPQTKVRWKISRRSSTASGWIRSHFARCNLPRAPAFPSRREIPNRVHRLVLVDGFARLADFLATPPARAVLSAVLADYVLGTEMIGPSAFGAGRDESVAYGAYIRQCVDADYFASLPEPFDVSDDATRLTMPVLLIRQPRLGTSRWT